MNKNIKNMHLDAFMGKSNYIPLAVRVRAHSVNGYSEWELLKNPALRIDTYLNNNRKTREFESDFIHFLDCDYRMNLIPSLFGAQSRDGGEGVDVLQLFTDIEQTADIGEIDSYGGQMPDALYLLKYLMEHRIEGVEITTPRYMSPLDYAVMMRGGEIFLDMYEKPELVTNFLGKITEAAIQNIKIFKSILNEEPNGQITVRGLYFPGIRLAGDSVVNLSPDYIRKFMFPVFKRFAEEFGYVILHYCTTPAYSAHVINALLECPYVKAVDNWQGYKTLFDENGEGLLQNKISVCTDLTPENIENLESFYFNEPFFSEVERKGGRGILAAVVVDSVDEGKRLYDKWVNYFIKNNLT